MKTIGAIRNCQKREKDYKNLVLAGTGTYGLEGLMIHSWDTATRIHFGNYCSIADNIHVFLGGNHATDKVSTYPFGSGVEIRGSREGHPKSKGDIIIGSDVWIGSHASIMSGVQIGHGAVVAAFSHVVRDVKPYEIVGGNPAKHIRFRFDEETIREFLAMKWWEWPESRIKEEREFLTMPVAFYKQKKIEADLRHENSNDFKRYE
jgi:acetyltransferase-like isoleucine patch superfamily enzyme